MKHGTHLAALDLGSNSFRLEIGRYDDNTGRIHQQAYYKEAIHQGAGLDNQCYLNEAAMQRGWDCLARFSKHLIGFEPSQVHAVATQTLREAHNRDVFLTKAHQILGFPIDVVSGHEEARLIYQGVAHNLPTSDEQRLVVDIGGRSTELILGNQFQAQVVRSYHLGSSAWSQRYFSDGQLTPTTFHHARLAALAVLDEIKYLFSKPNWQMAYGSSGTVGAVAEVLNIAGFGITTLSQIKDQAIVIPAELAGRIDGVITKQGLLWLQTTLLKFQHIDHIQLDGLKDERRLVIAAGLIILLAIFDVLDIEYMIAAQGALRHGALYSLINHAPTPTD